ncbi:VanZ family protein [bacterium]
MKLSKITIFYSAYIIISAAFMRQVLNFLKSHLSQNGLSVFVWCIFILAGIPLIYFIKKYIFKQKKYLNFLLLSLIIIIGAYYASTFHIIEERVHIALFGLLGFLTVQDFYKQFGRTSIIIALIYSFLIASIDEIFQYFLPYRFGDIRDVLFGTIGALWGIAVYFSIFENFTLIKLQEENT